MQLGADIVVQSAHKTLPAMTMGSFLHVNSNLVSLEKVKDYLEVFQSSSPSYPIMASLDLARSYLGTYEQRDLAFLLAEIKHFKEALAVIPAIIVLDFPDGHGDVLKMTIQSRCGLSGFELQKRLEEYSIYTELADPNNVLFILPLLKEGQQYPLEETVSRIKMAFASLPVIKRKEEFHINSQKITELAVPFEKMDRLTVDEAAIAEAEGLVCAETITPYPPGIPLLIKGERITALKLSQLQQLVETGARFQGGSTIKNGLIKTFHTT
ncbi:hypothetical protein [Neobacillus sp. 19]|uniref:Orn/Lys/Arg family decarboxylase n=1 Tax=Neobacillus sp. 19 TaxID=3394458 RepID=UPI003BF71F57